MFAWREHSTEERLTHLEHDNTAPGSVGLKTLDGPWRTGAVVAYVLNRAQQ
jgi:hypothetical protein